MDSKSVAQFAKTHTWVAKEFKNKEDVHNCRSNNEIKVILKAGEVFRIPIVWLMRDSKVDLLVQTERPDVKEDEQSLISLFQNIQSLFNQSANIKSTDIEERLKS